MLLFDQVTPAGRRECPWLSARAKHAALFGVGDSAMLMFLLDNLLDALLDWHSSHSQSIASCPNVYHCRIGTQSAHSSCGNTSIDRSISSSTGVRASQSHLLEHLYTTKRTQCEQLPCSCTRRVIQSPGWHAPAFVLTTKRCVLHMVSYIAHSSHL